MPDATPLMQVGPKVWSNGHLRFDPVERQGSRPMWNVRLASSGLAAAPVGKIVWHGLWREYALFTISGYVFAHDCLRDIAQFCEIHSGA